LYGSEQFLFYLCAHRDSPFGKGLRWVRQINGARSQRAQARDASLASSIVEVMAAITAGRP
jgi:hypothetical protein